MNEEERQRRIQELYRSMGVGDGQGFNPTQPQMPLDDFKKAIGISTEETQPTKIDNGVGVFEKIGNFIGGTKIAQGLAQAINLGKASKTVQETLDNQIALQGELIKTIRTEQAAGNDTTKLRQALKDLSTTIGETGMNADTILNPNELTNKQVLGDAANLALTATGASALGAAAKGATTTQKIANAAKVGAGFGAAGGAAEALKNDGGVADIAKGAAIGAGIGGVGGAALSATQAAVKGVSKLSQKIAPSKTLDETVGAILQGQTKDIKSGVRALSSIETSGIKTYDELNTALKNKIPQLASIVDNELTSDIAKTLDELATTTTSKSGQSVTTNYVTKALNDLRELYTSIGDDVSRVDIEETISKATRDGLTPKEVNDIARVYGSEFGSKAFGKTGEALTGVNAQAFENTRKGLKAVARKDLVSDAAKEADAQMSAIFNTQRLVQRNIEAANKAQQKLKSSGLLEGVGQSVAKFANMLTLGSAKGILKELIPIAGGKTTMNALDIEKALSKNLSALRKISTATTKAEITKNANIFSKTINLLNKEMGDFGKPVEKYVKDYIKNPKIGLSIEDISKKNSLNKESILNEFKKYNKTINIQDKNDLEYLRRILSEDQIKDIKSGKMVNFRGIPYEDLAKVNIISETPQTIEQQLNGKIKTVKLKNNTFYHGTSSENAKNIMSTGFKRGSELPEDIFRGGGYGKMQNSISLTETAKDASRFSTLSKNGKIIEVKLKPNLKVVSIDGVEDATDLEDYIDYLKNKKIDAVYIGGGEKELVIINKKAIIPFESKIMQ